MSESNGELSRSEREALAGLSREAVPPAELEERTVRALHDRGLLRASPRGRARRARRIGLALAASVLLLLAGYALGLRSAAVPPAGGAQFALLLYEGPEYRQAPAGREAERVREYSAWAGERAVRGELVAGEKLREEPDVVVGTDGSVVTVPPVAGAARLAGFFIVRAADGRAAVEIARSCPHVRYGGSIVVRAIDPTS